MQQLNQVFSFRNTDKILADLPLSHVWGSSISSVLPAVLGTPVHYKTSSSDSQEIGRVVSQERITILFTTPELLSSFVKGLESPKFGSLRTVIVGGDPMTRELASEFREKFGLYPFEAYGCAECSPGVSVNIFDFRASGLHQVGNRTGSVGRGLPGLALKIGETSTLEDAGFDNPGIL
ncbi:MAG: AMP-binding protein, partial [Pirellulaceae bacterium]|nr:AMP-binding protein [Pirellulaceae bacterium]